MILLPLLVVVVIVVVTAVSRHRRPADAMLRSRAARAGTAPGSTHVPASGHAGRTDPLARTLAEWQEAGLIRADEVEPILRYEEAKAVPRSRIPLAAEAVGYVGSALVITAVALLVGRRWDDIAVGLRVAVLAVPAIVAAAVGWWVGAKADPAFERLGSIVWVLSDAALAGAMTVVFVDVIYDGDLRGSGGPLFVGGIVTVWAAVQYLLRRLPLQQLALFGASLTTVIGVVNVFDGMRDQGYSSIVWGLAIWAFALAWTGLGVTERLHPSEVARLVGPATLLIAAQIVQGDAEVFGLWLGLATAALLIGVGVWRADLLVLLTGAVGLFQWAPQLAVFYLADAIGAEATLLVVGVVLLGVAYAFTRLLRRVRSDAGQEP